MGKDEQKDGINNLSNTDQPDSQHLYQTLTQTIQAISKMAERKDPYTAGHQNRVALLATAIAKNLGLSKQQIEGLYFGALIHDLGKIAIPAEILNRPGELTESEFELIKTHPQIGYDFIKDVHFPWPIAQMILQHHEHLDGSGYPKGLKNEEIDILSRILCVADVVEAMMLPRPYRHALGLDKALDELIKGRGELYDSQAVDTCIKLFREKGFKFKQGGAK